MALLTGGSSEQVITRPVVAAESVAVDKLAALSIDEPLPATYGTDRIRLFAQSPRRLYLYWDLSRDPLIALRRAFGNLAERYRLIVRLLSLDGDEEVAAEASQTRSQWFDARPGTAYHAIVGLFAPGRPFIQLLESERVRTPRASVARSADSSPEWRISADEFAHVLDESGYAADALEVALEAADEATRGRATRAVAAQFGGPAALPSDEDMEELRAVLAALAFGASFEELRPLLSKRVHEWLERIRTHAGNLVSGKRLFEILHSTLGFEATGAPFAAPGHAAMRTPRVLIGGSEVHLPNPPVHLWLPSMNAAILLRPRTV